MQVSLCPIAIYVSWAIFPFFNAHRLQRIFGEPPYFLLLYSITNCRAQFDKRYDGRNGKYSYYAHVVKSLYAYQFLMWFSYFPKSEFFIFTIEQYRKNPIGRRNLATAHANSFNWAHYIYVYLFGLTFTRRSWGAAKLFGIASIRPWWKLWIQR